MVYHLSNPLVAPVSMYYQKSLQKPKLGNGEVTSHHSLQKVTSYELQCKEQVQIYPSKGKTSCTSHASIVHTRMSINHYQLTSK